jgi:hypothetical protein
MAHFNIGTHLSRLLVGLVALSLGGCIELSAPLTDPATSEPDDSLSGEWVADLGHLKRLYLGIRPSVVPGAPRGLMQFRLATYRSTQDGS